MLIYTEIIELRDKLANCEIGLEFAQAQYWKDFKEGQKSWETKDWKERRSKIIKDKCEICSSRDTLTLQHHSHPRKYSNYRRDVTRAYVEKYSITNAEIDKTEFSSYVISNYDYVAIPLCPNCKNTNPYRRVRKLPQYRCTMCRHEFDEVMYRSVDDLISIFYENEDELAVRDKCFLSKDQWRTKYNLLSIKNWLQRQRAENKGPETIKKEAFYFI